MLDSDLEQVKKAWTMQLYREFDDISYRYRVTLKRPVIQLLDLRSRWGHWDSQTRTIALATRLIRENPWESVLEVFKHEMAHQYVDEVLGVVDQHGPFFKKACVILGVEAWAQKAELHTIGSLSELSVSKFNAEEEALLRRIERLLALANSSNEHEAIAAMNKVSELHEKYHLEQLEKKQLEEFTSVVVDHKLRRLPAFHGTLASILTSYFSVQVIFSSLYDPEKLRDFKTIEILGHVQNVKLAEYVYWFLYNTLNALWRVYQEATDAKGLAARNTYYLGVLKGFESKMQKTKKERAEHAKAEEKSLILLGQKRLEGYLAFRHPRLHSVRWTRRGGDARIYQDGVARGKELTIHSGLSDSNKGGKMKYLDRWSTS